MKNYTLTKKELALQKLDEALQACEDAVNSSGESNKKLYLVRFSGRITSLKDTISSLPENPNP